MPTIVKSYLLVFLLILALPRLASGQNAAIGEKKKVVQPKEQRAATKNTAKKLRNSTKPGTDLTPQFKKNLRQGQSEQYDDAQIGDAESMESKHIKAYDQNRHQTFNPKNNTEPDPNSVKLNRQENSGEQAKFAPGEENPETNKGGKRETNRTLSAGKKLLTRDSYLVKKAKEKAKSGLLNAGEKLNSIPNVKVTDAKLKAYSAKLAAGEKLNSIPDVKVTEAKLKAHNAKLAAGEKLNSIPDVKVTEAKIKAHSAKLAAGEKLNSIPDVKVREAKIKAKSEKLAGAVVGNTMDRLAYRKMLKEKGRKLMQAEKGNTLARTDYEKMVQRKSKRMAEAVVGNTLGTLAHERLMKNKSEDIANYNTGYLNTKAERKARLRSLIFPKEYQANSPQEQKRTAKRMSDNIASFTGKRKRAHIRHIENAHPSSRLYAKRHRINSIEDRTAAQRKGSKQMAKNKKAYLPVFMRKDPKKSKYSDIEKGIWYR